jgi:hypothetical protein
VGDDDVHAHSDELSRDLASAIAAPPGIAYLERDIPALRIAKVLQTTSEGIGERMRRRGGHQHADERQFSRLRARQDRPRCRRAAEQRDELAPLHV